MLSPKQIGTICFAIFSFIFPASLFATDISSSASTADCKHTPLQVYSGTSNLEADWTANTIALHWYNGDTELTVPSASQSCVYDGTLTPPTTIPTKTGYTFKGWRARDLTCGLSGLSSTAGLWFASKGGTGECFYINQSTGDELFGDCSDSHFAGLNNGYFYAGFDYGIVNGAGKCSNKVGDNDEYSWSNPSSNWAATESQLTSAGNGGYCWCRIISYTPNNGTQCNLTSSLWVFFDYMSNSTVCTEECTAGCADAIVDYGPFRTLVFTAHN